MRRKEWSRWQQESVRQHITQMSGMDMDAASQMVRVCSFFQIAERVRSSMEKDQTQIRKEMSKMARPKKRDEDKVIRQSVSMDREQLRQVVAYCQTNERTIAWVIKKAVATFLMEQTAGNKAA